MGPPPPGRAPGFGFKKELCLVGVSGRALAALSLPPVRPLALARTHPEEKAPPPLGVTRGVRVGDTFILKCVY